MRIDLYGHYADRAQDDELLQRQLSSCRRGAQSSLTLRIIFVFVVDPITDVECWSAWAHGWIIFAAYISMFAESDIPFN